MTLCKTIHSITWKILTYIQLRIRLGVIVALMLGTVYAQAGTVVHIKIDGTINPVAARFISESIKKAAHDNAEALIIEMDTPGGLMASTHVIVKDILAAEVPVVVYVAPSGARAGSAGVFITLSANIAAMAPGTRIGAAHPVSLGMTPTQKDSTGSSVMDEKVLNDAVAFIRSIAERRGRNADWAELAVRESKSITEKEALELKVIDLVTPSIDSLLIALNGRKVSLNLGEKTLDTKDATIVDYSMSFRYRFLDLISDPNIAYILLLLGIYGLFFELYNPGAILPGIVGGICIILAFFAFQTLPINYAGVLLILLSIVLFLLEIKVTSYGMLTIGGVLSLILGSIMLVESPVPAFRVSLGVIFPAALVTALFFVFAVGMGIRAQARKPTTGSEGIVGEIGVVEKALKPRGQIMVHGELWAAEADSDIEVGQKVEVVSMNRLVAKVKKVTS
jgi:membrane-bound serine protease (ClpP class)